MPGNSAIQGARSAKSTRRHAYRYIEHIDARQIFAAQNIIFCWRDGLFAFSVNLGDAASLRSLLVFFAGRQIPLTERARKIIRES